MWLQRMGTEDGPGEIVEWCTWRGESAHIIFTSLIPKLSHFCFLRISKKKTCALVSSPTTITLSYGLHLQ
jgi:hypothetical protein